MAIHVALKAILAAIACSLTISTVATLRGMSGLIIIFSALGGTIGSRIVGELFENIGGASAFYFLLIPMGLLIIFVLIAI